MITHSKNTNIVLIKNTDEKGHTLSYSVVDTSSKMHKDDFKEFNSLKEARAYIKNLEMKQ